MSRFEKASLVMAMFWLMVSAIVHENPSAFPIPLWVCGIAFVVHCLYFIFSGEKHGHPR